MDAKITKTRLSRMLSYDWIKIVALAIAAIVVWSLIFTMTATRITPAQQFTVFNYTGNVSLSTKFFDSYNKALTDGVFSHEVLEINYNDLTLSEEYVSTMLETRLSTNEGDVIFIADVDDTSTSYTDENGETKYAYTYLESFVARWYPYLADLDPERENSYFGKMEGYLNVFYTEGYQNADSLDEKLVEEAFLARIEKNRDKRYKKEEQIRQGIANDIERIKKYRDALVSFYEHLDHGCISLTTVTLTDSTTGEESLSGVYGINLCPNVDTMGGLKDMVCHRVTYTDENGEEKINVTAENMNVALFDLSGVEEGFEYESLLYVMHLVNTYCTVEA